jgi:hypothetical protein
MDYVVSCRSVVRYGWMGCVVECFSFTMRFGTCNVRSMYRAGSLRPVGEEISKYKFDLVGVQEVRWDGCGTEKAGEYTFFYGKGNENHELGTAFFVHNTKRSLV